MPSPACLFDRPNTSGAKKLSQAVVKQARAKRKIKHGKTTADEQCLPKALSQIEACDANLFRADRSADSFQPSFQFRPRQQLLSQTFAQLRPPAAQPLQLETQGFRRTSFGATFLDGHAQQFRVVKKFTQAQIPIHVIAPCSTAALHVELIQRLLQQAFIKRGDRQGANAHLESMRRRATVANMVAHVPQVTEL